jgi:hypothetical protein
MTPNQASPVGTNRMTTTQLTSDPHAPDHTHSGHHEVDRPSYDDINVPVVVLIGVISAVLTLATIWFVEGLYYRWNSSLVRARNFDVTNPLQAEVINGQKLLIEDGDPEKGFSGIGSVMPEIIDKYKQGQATRPSTDAAAEAETGHNAEGHQ